MTAVRRASLALAFVFAALLSDWLWSELFLRRDGEAHIAGALLANALVLLAAGLLARAALPARVFVVLLRGCALFGFAVLVIVSLRAAVAPGVSPGFALKLGLAAVVALAALGAAAKLGEASADRLMTALVLACIGFVAVPFAWRFANAAPRVWIEAAAPARTPNATLFLLLDELGYEAAAPLADDLRAAGLKLRYDALVPAGENTLNVIPAMFSGLDFARARPCGAATLCSGSNTLDFSRLRVLRPDVDATGLLLPYCDIAGLRSCWALPLPHEYGSAYRSLAAFWVRRLGLPLPAALAPRPDPPAQQRELLQRQVERIDASRVWSDGGILFAHLPIPHPPGLDGVGRLDADYAANIEQARTLVRGWAARAGARFGEHFSIVITSDHPLRKFWCTTGPYTADACRLRPAFRDDRVPLIVASPGRVSTRVLAGNEQVFRILNDQAGSAPH